MKIAGRYRVQKTLGKGGGGTTYLVEDSERGGSPLALKALSHEKRSPEVHRAFLAECKILKNLSHPHLAHLIDYGEDPDQLYYTSEFVEGENFCTACRQRSWNAVLDLVVQGSWALDYLHRQGVVHLDLKPQNILVGKVHRPDSPQDHNRQVLKLIDFGMAHSLQPGKAVTQRGGTLTYMAPEVMGDHPYDQRADLYSWGVVLYEMAFGRLPHAKAKGFAKYMQALQKEEVDLRPLEENEETPRGLIEVIRRLVKKKSGERISQAREIIETLNQIEGESFPLEPPVREGKTLPLSSESEAVIPQLTQPQALVDAMLIQLRAGKKQEASKWIQGHWKLMQSCEDLYLAEKFFGAAIQIPIERGEFEEARRLIQEIKKYNVFIKKASLELVFQEILLEYYQGNYSKASELFKSVPRSLQESVLPDLQARFVNIGGMIAQSLRRFEEAAEFFQKAARLSIQSGRKDHQASFLLNVGTLYQDQGNWKGAYEAFTQVEGLARSLGHETLLANVLSNLGNLYLYFGRLRDAEAAFFESLDLARKQGLKPLLAYNLYLLTVGEDERGNWEHVQGYLKEALEFTKGLGEAQPILQVLLAEGYFYFNRGDYPSSEKSIQSLREHALKTQQTFYLQQADWLEAKVKIQSGLVQGFPVSQWLQEVEQDARKRDQKHTLWQVLADRGDLARLQEQKLEAQTYYESALEVIVQLQKVVPKAFQQSFYRDRKKEKVRKSLKELGSPAKIFEKPAEVSGSAFNFNWEEEKSSPKTEVIMDYSETPQETKKPQAVSLSFQKWTEINRRLLTQQDVDALLEEILDAAIEFTDAERGFVIHSPAQQLDIRAARNMDHQSLETEQGAFSKTIAQEVMRKGEPSLIMDALEEERFQEAQSVHTMQIRSVLCIPLKSGPRTVGLVYLDNRMRQGVFQPNHLPLLEALTDQASLALEHARLHQENRVKMDLIEELNRRLAKDLQETSSHLEALREGMKREHEELSLKYSYDKIIGKSAELKKVLVTLDRIVAANVNVFIFGESGTGKELIAQAIHFNSPRKERPFITENCAALSETLLESELFGHVKGAFTGADRDKIGLFQMANGGTLFLDEIGEMPLTMQAKLLRVLQEGEVRPVGGQQYRKVDVRVVSASNRDIKKMTEDGTFRQDLFYRLNGVRLNLPTLRARREDIPLLVDHFLDKISTEEGGGKPKLTRETLRLLTQYYWPGNIRELFNEIKRLYVLDSAKITLDMVSPHILSAVKEESSFKIKGGLDSMIAKLEEKAVTEAMEKYAGNKVKVAKALQITRRTLYAKLKAFNIG